MSWFAVFTCDFTVFAQTSSNFQTIIAHEAVPRGSIAQDWRHVCLAGVCVSWWVCQLFWNVCSVCLLTVCQLVVCVYGGRMS